MSLHRNHLLFAFIAFFIFSSWNSVLAQAQLLKPDYVVYDKLLQKYVSADGLVDYKGLRKDEAFGACLTTMALTHPDRSWSRDEQIAFWINLYNMFTLKLICDNPQVKSIKDIPDAWDKKWIKIGKHLYSLNQIEHEILRTKYPDPRIHFAVNCAALSCPKLLNHAYFPATLNKTLDQVTGEFINNNKHNQLTPDSAKFSSIFSWYYDDFIKYITFVQFVNKYSTVKLNASVKIEYNEYNWALNSR